MLDVHYVSAVGGNRRLRAPRASPQAAASEPGRPLVGPRRATTNSGRHRAGRTPLTHRQRADLGWPLMAVLVVGLLGARATVTPARLGEGELTAHGVLLLTPGAGLPVPASSPEGVGALHSAVYGTVTRALDRHETLVAVDRELALVAILLSCVLLWRTARRVGLGDPASAAAVLLLGLGVLGLAALPAAPAVDGVALLALPWLLLAGYLLAPGRPAPAAMVTAILATAVAVLLAPDVLVLVVSLAAAAVTGSAVLRRVPTAGRVALVTALTALVVGVALALDRWDPQPVAGTVLAGSGLLLGLVGLIALAGLSGWRLRRLRAPAVGVLATAASFILTGRLPALLVGLPLAALLVAGAGEQVLRQAWAAPVRARARLALRMVAGLALGGVAAAALFSLLRTTPTDLGARDQAMLLAWIDEQLPPEGRVVAPPRIWAGLVHAGADTDQVRLPGTAGAGRAVSPVLTVVEGDLPGGSTPVARFGPSGGRPDLLLADGSARSPTPEELARRRTLAAALLANPMTADGSQAAGVLASAEVDPRLLALLAGIGVQLDVGLAAFPPVAGEERTGTLVRHAVLLGGSGAPLRPGAPETERLLAWLGAQWPPFAPDTVQVTNGGVGIGYRYVSAPDALVTEAMS